MSVDLLKCNDTAMMSLIDKYLNEDDKGHVFEKLKYNNVRAIHDGDAFVLYSTANKVKAFIKNGHFVDLICYGIDYFLHKKPSTFCSMNLNSHEQVEEAVNDYCYEWYQESGEIDNDLLDKVYAWLLISPYTAMVMTEGVRNQLHKTVEYLWMCTATNDQAFANECYSQGKVLVNSKLDSWFENVPILRRGCGYANIIEPMEV